MWLLGASLIIVLLSSLQAFHPRTLDDEFCEYCGDVKIDHVMSPEEIIAARECRRPESVDQFATALPVMWHNVKNHPLCFDHDDEHAFLRRMLNLRASSYASPSKRNQAEQLLARLKCIDFKRDQKQAAATTLTGTEAKYEAYGTCCNGHGMWFFDTRPTLFCFLKQLVDVLDIRPYDTILDWGGGCGHMLSFFSSVLHTYGINVDMSQRGIEYSNDIAQTKGCYQDGTNLSNIPSNSIDHVFSYGALLHVETVVQCNVIHQMLRVLKPGGAIWVGYLFDWEEAKGEKLDSFMLSCDFIEECVAAAPDQAMVSQCSAELDFFGVNVYMNAPMYHGHLPKMAIMHKIKEN